MHYVENNMLNTSEVMKLLRSIYSDSIAEQCTEAEFPYKIQELTELREAVISLPFHQSIPDEIMRWVKHYFSERYVIEQFYDFRHYTQRSFIHAIDETIQTLHYDLSVSEELQAVDISEILKKIFKD